MTHTKTFAMLAVPPEVYYWIRTKLVSAGYDHAIDDNDVYIIMDEIAIKPDFEMSLGDTTSLHEELSKTNTALVLARQALRGIIQSDEQLLLARAAAREAGIDTP